jgi:hypothetical protein
LNSEQAPVFFLIWKTLCAACSACGGVSLWKSFLLIIVWSGSDKGVAWHDQTLNRSIDRFGDRPGRDSEFRCMLISLSLRHWLRQHEPWIHRFDALSLPLKCCPSSGISWIIKRNDQVRYMLIT